MHMRFVIGILLLLLTVSGQAEGGWNYPVSKDAFYAVAHGLALQDVRRHPEYYLGTRLLLAGEISGSERKEDQVVLEIECYPLSEEGRPLRDAQSCGRFIAHSTRIERETYAPGRLVTLTATLVGARQGEPGLPVFTVGEIHPWPSEGEKRERLRRSFRYQRWHDPFCHSWSAPYPYRHCW